MIVRAIHKETLQARHAAATLLLARSSKSLVDPLLPARPVGLEVLQHVPVDAQRDELLGIRQRARLASRCRLDLLDRGSLEERFCRRPRVAATSAGWWLGHAGLWIGVGAGPWLKSRSSFRSIFQTWLLWRFSIGLIVHPAVWRHLKASTAIYDLLQPGFHAGVDQHRAFAIPREPCARCLNRRRHEQPDGRACQHGCCLPRQARPARLQARRPGVGPHPSGRPAGTCRSC